MKPRVVARIRPHVGGLVISGCFFVLAALFGFVNPPFESYDEPAHYLFVRHLAQGNSLPVREIHATLREANQGPLYYALAALATFYIDTRDIDLALRWNPSGLSGGDESLDDNRVADNRNKVLHGPWEVFPWRGSVLAVHVARLLSAILGSLTVLLTYVLAREVFPRRQDIPLLAAIGVAVNVQFVYLSSAVSNDVLVACLSTGALVLLLRMVRLGPNRRRSLLGGILIGLAALAKTSGIMLLPLGVFALLLATARCRLWATGLRSTLWLTVSAVVVCSWWYVRNQVLYNDWSGLRNVFLEGTGRSTFLPVIDVLAQFDSVARTFYLPADWSHFRVPEPIYVFAAVVLALGILGLIIVLGQRLGRLVSLARNDASALVESGRRGVVASGSVPPRLDLATGHREVPGVVFRQGEPSVETVDRFTAVSGARRYGAGSIRSFVARLAADDILLGLVILLTWSAVNFAALYRYIQISFLSNNGRFIIPAFSAIYILLASGWLRLLPGRLARGLPLGLGALGFLWALVYLLLFLAPAYAPPPLLGPDQLGAMQRRVDAHAGDSGREIALLGYDLPVQRATPGDIVPVDVYWQSLRQTDQDYMVFVHLTAPGQEGAVAQKDTHPGLGNFPTSAWRPGNAIRDTYRVALPESLTAPQILDVEVGMYDWETGARLNFTFDDGRPPVTAIHLGRIRLFPRQPDPLTALPPIDVLFGESVHLSGVGLERVRVQDADRLALTLQWQAVRPLEKDYTVFVHVLDGSDKIVAQTDKQPADGRWPTRYWEVDQLVEDRHDVILPNLQPGTYRVVVGLYDWRSGARLNGASTSVPIMGGGAVVAEFTITDR